MPKRKMTATKSQDDVEESHQSGQPEYGTKQYWEARYAVTDNKTDEDVQAKKISKTPETSLKSEKENGFEWFLNYDDLEPLIEKYVPKPMRTDGAVVDLGCGDSSLLFDLADNGFNGQLLGIDFAAAVVDYMQAESESRDPRGNVNFKTGDVTNLELSDESVDIFFDKSTMDTLMHDTKTGASKVSEMISHVARVLKPNGIHMIVTQLDLDVDDDMQFFQDVILNSLTGFSCNWKVDVHRSGARTDSDSENEDENENEQPRGLQVYVLRKTKSHAMPLRRGRKSRSGQVTLRVHDHDGDDSEDEE